MNILILGSGGREHTIGWKLIQSSLVDKLFFAPGNGGTEKLGINLNINILDFKSVEKTVLDNSIGLVIVGPEDPIVNGIYNYFKSNENLKETPILSPSANAAKLEGSKDFAKEFMQRHGIPTAAYKSFESAEYTKAKAYINSHSIPVVIKADGLAAGKGVTVALSKEEAIDAIEDAFLNNKFGDAGTKVVIEAFLDGIELSVFVLTDGKNYLMLPEAKDYKQIGEGNTGPNTGGMGSISPVPFADDLFMEKVRDRIIEPTIQGFKSENMDYRGFVFFGLMNVNGDPFVIEYNVRLGDPETEAILPRIEDDLVPLLLEAANGNLKTTKLKISEIYSATVMLVSGGYPGNFEKGKTIEGLENVEDSNVFIAGAKLSETGLQTSGGRVMAINSLDHSLPEAIKKSYYSINKICFDKMNFRKDIGFDLIKYLE